MGRARAPAYATLAAGLSDLDSAERTLTERIRFTVADDLIVRSGAGDGATTNVGQLCELKLMINSAYGVLEITTNRADDVL